MQQKRKKRTTVPSVLCPFYERECLNGEEVARACWRRMNSDDMIIVDYDLNWVQCPIADWMFQRELTYF
jgi:hypothetical protein